MIVFEPLEDMTNQEHIEIGVSTGRYPSDELHKIKDKKMLKRALKKLWMSFNFYITDDYITVDLHEDNNVPDNIKMEILKICKKELVFDYKKVYMSHVATDAMIDFHTLV